MVRLLNGSLSVLGFLVIGAVTSVSSQASTSDVAFASCPGPIEWQKAFGGLPNSQNQVRQTSGGGFVLGSTVTDSRGFDYRIVRIDAHGTRSGKRFLAAAPGTI